MVYRSVTSKAKAGEWSIRLERFGKSDVSYVSNPVVYINLTIIFC